MRPGLVTPGRLPGPGRLPIPSGSQPTAPVESPPTASTFEQPTVPLPAGQRGPEPAFVQLVIDESSSEQALDPNGYRHVAGRRTLALLRNDLTHPDDRLACVHFTHHPFPWLRPTSPHTKLGHRALRTMLQPIRAGDGTDIRAALSFGARLIPRDWAGAVVVILLSDGQDASSAAQLISVVGRFPPGAVHSISVGQPLPDTWAVVPLGSRTVIPTIARPDEVEWATARALYRALGLDWHGTTQPPLSRSGRGH